MAEYENLKERAERLIGEIEANLADPGFLFSAESVESTCKSLRDCAVECRALGTDGMNRLAALLQDTFHEVRERVTDWKEPLSDWEG